MNYLKRLSASLNDDSLGFTYDYHVMIVFSFKSWNVWRTDNSFEISSNVRIFNVSFS